MARLHTGLGWGGILGCLVGALACGDEEGGRTPLAPLPEPGDGQFISSLPGTNNSNGANEVAATSGASPGFESNVADDGAAANAPRAIAEADILQLSGDRLYALSRFNGLSVVDASNPAQLRLEGSYRTAAEPFEMYVEDGIVIAMFNGWFSYTCDDDGLCSWQAESRVQALDTRDPANIRLLADLEVPGGILDSRRVGEVMYLVTNQWGGCWGCDSEANTRVTSFDVSDPSRFAQLDELKLPSAADSYGGSTAITVTDQRIYIGGDAYDTTNYQQLPGSIEVVDISDPGGALLRGTTVSVAGPLQSRWQMDESDGVLRVITQLGGWGSDSPPVLQTFRVLSSSEVQPAGSLSITLPRPREVLQSVRFDGTRAYAITAERRDPLFTFDLSDPAAPRQLGELEMPGWVYHMEPRGNRMYALGFDEQAEGGSLNVSLFDVEDLASPRLLARVPFGGDWGNFAESQNQIHKAFSILPDQGLIMVPFAGTNYDEQSCIYDFISGIQLIDFTSETLTLRGVAPQSGVARRALLHRDSLFGVGDNAVQTFDISNRDAPVELNKLDVARNVSTVRVLGDRLMRFGSDWNTNQTILDLTPLERASDPQPQAELDLASLFGEDTWTCRGGSSWGGQVFTRGSYAYVPRYTYRYDGPDTNLTLTQFLTFFIVDMSDPNAPRAVGRFTVPPATGDTSITNVVQTDNALLVGRTLGGYNFDYRTGKPLSRSYYYYDVLDLSDPENPKVASRFEVPEQAASGGWGYFGVSYCSVDMGWGWYANDSSNVALTDGDMVVSQHSVPVPDQPGRVRYYLDRIDVSDPYAPRMLPAINIPGTAIHFNGSTNELVTLDYSDTLEQATSPEDCYMRGAWGWFDSNPAECHVTRRSLNSLVLDGDTATLKSTLPLDDARRMQNIAVSDNRIFYTTAEHGVHSYYFGALPENQAPSTSAVQLESLLLNGGELTPLASRELHRVQNGGYYYANLYARDERVFEIFDNTVTVIDTLDPANVSELSVELPNWGCASLEVANDTAYCASGQRGVEVIDLSTTR